MRGRVASTSTHIILYDSGRDLATICRERLPHETFMRFQRHLSRQTLRTLSLREIRDANRRHSVCCGAPPPILPGEERVMSGLYRPNKSPTVMT